ncbi:kinase-like domain-containing protein [Rhizophagus irregularis DAOM 181602=DAOM 197198]|nr:kinase-like domain-containing protein [Rhizophagus irregularis DAOM 181602=DAOM 197198]
MSNNTESNALVKFTENSNNEWIEEAIVKDYIKCYEFNYFSNFQEIGFGGFGKVFRANWKSSHNYLALKSFFSFNNTTIKEIIKEFKIQREVDFHDNIIHFCGVTIENQNDNSKKYWLVMEYADSGTLQEYLKERFDNLIWNNKFDMANQLACAILCLHDEGIIHHDLNSKNVGNPPFYSEGKPYDVCLAIDISQGLRETPILDTPEDYTNIYTDCWNNEPDNRPTINQVISKLNAIILNNSKNTMIMKNFQSNDSHTNVQSSSKQLNLKAFEDFDKNLPHGELSKIIQKFNKINIEEIEPSMTSDYYFKTIVDEMVELLNKTLEEGKDRRNIYDYFNNYDMTSQEIYIWLLNNQHYSNSIVLLGDFNYLGIEINVDKNKAFELYQNSSDLENAYGINNLGYCYQHGIGIDIDEKKAFELYQKSSDLGNVYGINNLGYCYQHGTGTDIDEEKAFELYQKAADLGDAYGINNLAYCYQNEIGTYLDREKAFELYQKAADLGDACGINNLVYYNFQRM